MTKYNWEEILNRSEDLAPMCETWTELSEEVGVPRRTLQQGLEREFGIGDYEDLYVFDVEDLYGKDLSRELLKKFGPKERDRVTRGLIRKMQRRLSDRFWLRDLITESVGAINTAPFDIDYQEEDDEMAMMVIFSDWHFGQDTPQELMGEYQNYDEIIADRRLQKYFAFIAEEIKWNLERYGSIKVILAFLGDEIEGSTIRDTQAKVISGNAVTQMLAFFSLVSTGIANLAREFPQVSFEIEGVPGNHSRITKSKKDSMPTETMDYAGYWYMAARLKGFGNISFKIPETWHIYQKIYGWGFFLTHGDGVRSYRGLPAYGLTKMGHGVQSSLMVEDKQMARKNPDMMAEDIRFVDYVVVGHFHSKNFLEDVDVEIIVASSPTGASPYSAKQLNRSSLPTQQILYIDRENGVFGHRSIIL